MNPEFDIGDRVTCIRPRFGLRMGEVYTVNGLQYQSGKQLVHLGSRFPGPYYSFRFRLFEDSPHIITHHKIGVPKGTLP